MKTPLRSWALRLWPRDRGLLTLALDWLRSLEAPWVSLLCDSGWGPCTQVFEHSALPSVGPGGLLDVLWPMAPSAMSLGMTFSPERLFCEPSVPTIPQGLWLLPPFITWLGTCIQKGSYMCLLLQQTNRRGSSSSLNLEGTKSYRPRPGRVPSSETASETGEDSGEKEGEGLCFRFDLFTGEGDPLHWVGPLI